MSEDTHTNGADVDLQLAGQKINLRNVKSVNTLATVLTLILTILIAYVVWMHTGETKEASRELTGALKEMTQAAREQNCLISMPIDRRDPELCKRLAR